MPPPSVDVLLRLLDEAYDKKAWHGPNLRGVLRLVTPREASWRPAPGRHTIHELVRHAAYWKYTVRNRILGGKRGSFVLKGSNWFDAPKQTSEKEWKADLRLLEDEHRQLRAAVEALSPSDLTRSVEGSARTVWETVLGVAYHDIYHAGQIQLIKKIHKR